ncbi:MAG TPA: asparagine--tRNA ligase [Myxococcota bacterium]|nr:asparagine--tRNA ligase [Myxococcota bacterium]HOS61740.1 asparagine--tRNA ligase [Myxococcota bacterium]HPC92267.1 asparagine--tRNA ligase [Myxococcota bacterium]HQE73965.1 asparagine--tRNA ligase [Myxococcota bacterium]HQI62074.1 asparagine--tRNA ligase [Myxococcota bacterium]
MTKAVVEKIAQFEGQEVLLQGWLAAKRSSGKIRFLQVRDGTGTIQCVMVKANSDEEEFAAADRCPQESSIEVKGTVRKDARSPIGFEIEATSFKIVAEAEPYPISPKDHGTAFLMEHRHLWLRSRRQHAILRIRATIVRAIRDYFDNNGFLLVDAPVLTPAACEGTTTLFELDYFGEKAYLTQSGQLYNEATAAAFGKTYCFGPTFRAEKSKTRRHLMEFWMVEPEMAYADLEENMRVAEDFLVYVVGRVLEERQVELATLERDLAPLEAVKGPFPRVHYKDAVAKLQELGSDIVDGEDFGADDETVLTKLYDRPIIVHHYPSAAKAFYMKPDPDDPKYCFSMDVLAPEGYGEVIGGGQREESKEVLEAAIEAHKLPKEAFEWYLDLRRYGSVPHSGFGLGVERTVAWICGLPHIRETIPFPRMLEKITP